MECIPAFRLLVVNAALPDPSRVAVPRLVVPSRKVTVPLGMPPVEVTVQVKVTRLPKTEGLADGDGATAIAVLALFTTCGLPESEPVLPLKFPSPP